MCCVAFLPAMMQDDSLESQYEEEVYNPPENGFQHGAPVSPMYEDTNKLDTTVVAPSPEYGTFVVQPVRETTDFLTDEAVPGTTKSTKESDSRKAEEDDLD
jgi:hypothetical protein